MLSRLGTPLSCCLALSVDTDEVIERLLRRSEIEGRSDDNEEAVRERMKVYDDQTSPLLDYYRGKDLLIEIPGMGTINDVSNAIEKALK